MDAPRFDEMSDAAIDRDLQALLATDPSPALVARVRTQITTEAATSWRWFGAWSSVLAGAATVVVVIVTLVAYRGSRRESVVGDHPAALTTRPLAVSAAAAGIGALVAGLQGGVLDRSEATSHVAARERTDVALPAMQESVAPPAAVASTEPEVLVDPREAAALRALIFGVRDGRIDLAAVVNAPTPAVMQLPPAAEIDITAITIEPIAPGTGEEGVRQ